MSTPLQPAIRSTRASTSVITPQRFLCTVAVRGRGGTNADASSAAPSAAGLSWSSEVRKVSHTPNRWVASTIVNVAARLGSLNRKDPWAIPMARARCQMLTATIRSAGTTKSTNDSR
jgi:hypothetical protein